MFFLGYFLIAIVSLLVFLLVRTGRPKNFPPGPKGYPILGNLTKFGNRHETYKKLCEEYGNILGLRFGTSNVVVLNNYRDIKDAFNEPALNGRPVSGITQDRNRGYGLRGVVFNHGSSWQEQRRFCLKNLRDFGFGKKSMELLVMDEVNELIANIVKTDGEPISTQNRFNGAVLNALWSIVASKRYSHDDPKVLEFFKQLTSAIGQPSLITMLGLVFPSVLKLQEWFPSLFPNKIKQFVDPVYEFFDQLIDEHKSTYQPEFNRDLIDVYLEAMSKSTDPSSSFYGQEGEKNLPVIMLDMFVAGGETTSSTLIWACLLLSIHSEIQEKLYREIEKNVGHSRHVSLTDRSSLLFLEAVIMEVMRYATLLPLGVLHSAIEDTMFHGYNIPKNTLIFPNLYSASRDKAVWGDPDVFRPERFLSEDGKTLIRNEALIPFSIGKRVCLGQSLAQDELFLFMGNLFLRFQMKTVGKIVDNDNIFRETFQFLQPLPHELHMIDRLK